MKEVLRTNDPVKLSYALSILESEGCKPFCADRFTASVQGGISAFQQRILVPDEFCDRAIEALKVIDEPLPPISDDDD